MSPAVIESIANALGAMVGLGGVTFFSLMCFPSFRAAIVERMRQRTLRHAEATDVVAQLALLRGEVYALRTELAQAVRPPGSLQDRPEGVPLPAGQPPRLPGNG
jgi:hypothetical protein